MFTHRCASITKQYNLILAVMLCGLESNCGGADCLETGISSIYVCTSISAQRWFVLRTAFPAAGFCVWNSLPQHITSAPSLPVFHSRLKTHFFRCCFLNIFHSLVPLQWQCHFGHFNQFYYIVFYRFLTYRYINSLNKEETLLIGDLALEVVRRHQRHMVISPWSLIATILIQSRDGISIRQLIKESDWLKRQAQNFGAYVDWPGKNGISFTCSISRLMSES